MGYGCSFDHATRSLGVIFEIFLGVSGILSFSALFYGGAACFFAALSLPFCGILTRRFALFAALLTLDFARLLTY